MLHMRRSWEERKWEGPLHLRVASLSAFVTRGGRRETAGPLVTCISQNAFGFSFVFSALCQPKCITQTFTLPVSPGQLKQLGAKSHSIVVPSLGLNLGVICLLMSVSRSWTRLTCCDSSKGPTAPQVRIILGLLLTHHSQVWAAYKLWQYLNCATHFVSSHLYILPIRFNPM